MALKSVKRQRQAVNLLHNILSLRAAAEANWLPLDDTGRTVVADRIAMELAAVDELHSLDEGRRAAVLLWTQSTSFFEAQQLGRIEIALGDAGAVAWVVETMRALTPTFADTLEISLPATYEALLQPLAAIGLHARLQHLHGCPRVALRELRANPIDRNALGADYRMEPLTTARQIDAILLMMAHHFRAHPTAGFFGPRVALTDDLQRRIDKHVGTLLEGALADRTAIVVVRGKHVVGYGSSHVRIDPLLGRVGGMALGFSAEIRGRGISKLVYEKLLERMVELDVAVMKGRSANPAVLHLAERMKRPVRGWQLEPAPLQQ
jgi:hypothetical protein